MSTAPARTGRSAAEKHRVLIADDDPVTRRVLSQYLAEAGYETVAAEDGREALQRMDNEISVGLLDLEMPHVSGLNCLRQLRKQHPHISVIMISGKGSLQDAVAAMKEGAFDYITKPFDRDELMARVHQGCRASQLGRDNEALREAVTPAAPSFEFVACSAIAQQLVRHIAKVAPLDSTVMLTGESGTGKTTVARMIHQSGPRADKPFVAVNCASLPRDLVEAELFGHTKGAFTGAVHDRPGRAEIADGGTLFLDEIGDLPLELQPKLLTFLQDRTFQRIGSNKIYTADVRMIAATHQDLAGMCREKRFREDLYFRLNVITIHVPALRDRLDDIPELARQILQRIGRRRGQPALACDAIAAAMLQRHAWHGNVRELENVLERASAFCEGPTIGAGDLAFPAATADPADRPLASRPPALAGFTLDELEKQAIRDTLQATSGNKAAAARELGISEKSIYNKMKRLGLSE
ncbi:MAG: sigma-54 dependent transcriptional regulator [Pirellulaceae bacterium]|nr:sigma-54 dependent transcriptional regulator [Pirellulaceae bacterium]